MELRFSQRRDCLVAPSPVHGHCYCPQLLDVLRDPRYESTFGHGDSSPQRQTVSLQTSLSVVADGKPLAPVHCDKAQNEDYVLDLV